MQSLAVTTGGFMVRFSIQVPPLSKSHPSAERRMLNRIPLIMQRLTILVK
jgi:hypothetical protein